MFSRLARSKVIPAFLVVAGFSIDRLNHSLCSPSISNYIDHTVLKPTCQEKDIKQLCNEAKQYNFAAVCVPPFWVPCAKRFVLGSNVKVATVIGFPFGYSSVGSKVEEIKTALVEGVDEVDIVANISAIKSHDYDFLYREIMELLAVIRSKPGVICKVIIESGVLTNEEIVECCKLYSAAGIDYLKTSTGYAEKGASIEAVKLFRDNLTPTIQIKASGGIRTYKDAKAMVEAGATRIGCSAGVNIVKEEMNAGTSTETAASNPGGGY